MTKMSRRDILAGSAALGGAAMLGQRGAAVGAFPVLRAAPAMAQIAPAGYPATAVWAYGSDTGGTIPGPEIRVRAGDRIRRRLINDLPQATAVHWHGVRIDNSMDGAAPLTQAPVPPGGAV